jgi:two-component system OmpR family response regulator
VSVSDTSSPTRVLVVDDEPNIVDVVSMALRHHGFDVAQADSGAEALARVRDWHPNVLVLDVMLPDIDGFEVARRLAADHTGVPILFLTARDATTDKVWGLTAGGGDYVTKPFSLEELIARLRNIVRRHRGEETTSRLQFADLELDEETREVSRGGRAIQLTATEYRLLHYFMMNPRRVLTRAQLLEHVWSYDFAGDARVLETYVSYLRKKIDGDEDPLLHTIRGVGYSLRLPSV